ncbi:unnamed protein product [Arabis nemorensis]|uniref:Cation/H+ exchanger transmembrane domain-containing protein n=1 Tax=Arabis nemorensis TaxID=586526 RepID=A0A565CS44_9BRAS|nr:unnamed protein product [Arabis nemorensis]
MVRYFPSDDRSVLPAHFGFWPGNPTGEVSSRVFSARLPVVCRQVHHKQPFGMFKGENAMNYAFSTFLIEAIIIIFFIKSVCFPLRQPRIVCEIIGGMMIGPSLFGGSRNFNYYLFPPIANYICANLGLIGFFYFLFLTAAMTDVTAIGKAPRKHKYIAAIGVFVPMICVGAVGMSMRNKMHINMKKPSALGGIVFALAFSSFPVIYTVLRDINLLNSEVGKFAMSVALLGDMAAINVLTFFEAWTQLDGGGTYALVWFLVSVVIFSSFMLLVVKRGLDWVVAQTPEGKLVDQNYIVMILMGVLVACFLTDMFGLSIAVGPIYLGLLVPHGPPLGSTLAVRSQSFIHEFLMPFTFGLVGLNTNVNFLNDEIWPQQLSPLFYMTIVGFITKFVSTVAAALFFKVPTRDSLTLGLMMNLRGQIDILLYLHWIDKRMIGLPGFTIMVLHTLVVTGISTPLISFLYDPTRPYRSSKHRTIQHTPPSTEMGLVLAVSDHEALAGVITFLDIAYPTKTSPFAIFAVQLVELKGRATPLLYQEKRDDCVNLRDYTAQAPKRLMYQDICELALAKKTAFILLPYQQERLEDATPACSP